MKSDQMILRMVPTEKKSKGSVTKCGEEFHKCVFMSVLILRRYMKELATNLSMS